MKEQKFLIILTLFAIMLSIQSWSQTVSEKPNCFTNNETDFFIGQAITVLEQSETISIQDSIIYNQKEAVFFLKKSNEEKEREISYKDMAFDNCASERSTLYNQLNKANITIKRQKLGLKIYISAAILLGAIAIIH